jgi:hypothetical protein
MYEHVRSKWNLSDKVPLEKMYEKLQELEARVKVLEEENVGTTNELYRLENSLDARIDILAEYCGIAEDV